MRLSLFAPAKVNLSLEIVGKRDDGYHDIRSFVCPADIGDELTLTFTPGATDFSLAVTGQFAADVPAENTLSKTFRNYCARFNFGGGIHVDIVKNIPSRAGLGSASSDAAALLRGLHTLAGKPLNDPLLYTLAATIGADVPACLFGPPCLVRGVGDVIDACPALIREDALLVWPGPGESTLDLYRLYDETQAHMKPVDSFSWPPSGDTGQWVRDMRNDFEPVAIATTPAVGDALTFVRALPGCRAARLTGSGTTVFGLFDKAVDPLPDLDFPWVRRCVIGKFDKPLVTRLG